MIIIANTRPSDIIGRFATGAGPRNLEEGHGAVRLAYCGRACRFQYYAKSVFLRVLAVVVGSALPAHAATERQFVDALRYTSLRMRNTHVVRNLVGKLSIKARNV